MICPAKNWTDVGDKFEMLVTDFFTFLQKRHQHSEQSRQHNDSDTNILRLSLSRSHQHHVVTNIAQAEKLTILILFLLKFLNVNCWTYQKPIV